MPTPVFYPSLSNLISFDSIPESLGVVRNGIENVFDKVFYKNLQVEISPTGDAGFYKLTLVLYSELGLEIPGTGVSIWLNRPTPANPNESALSNSEIPISLTYRFDILKYSRTFSSGSFSENAAAFFNLFLEIADVEPAEIVREAILVLVKDSDPVTKFVTDFNAKYSLNPQSGQTYSALTIPTDPNIDVFESLFAQMEAQGFDHELGIFTDLINNLNSLEEIFGNIRNLFNRWLGNITLEDFKKLLIPQFSASIDSITVGVEFPDSLFRAVDETNNYIPYSPDRGAFATFDVGSVGFSSNGGFEFNSVGSFDFPYAEILRTGFIFNATDVKLDFNREKNIPEANADGRPADFIGVYIQEANIIFPPDWGFDTGSNAVLKIKNMLAGTGGLSGILGMDSTSQSPLLEGTFGSNIGWTLDRFEIAFQQNAIVSSNIHGTLTVPGFTNDPSGPATLDIDIHIGTNGDFNITASELLSPPTWKIAEVLKIAVSSAFVGRKDGRFYLGVTGKIDFIADVPFLGDVLPKGVEVKKLIIWDDGNIEFEGGNLILPNAIALKVGPVKLSVTALSMGSYERSGRKYKYVGFDGGINISPGGVDARANGVKLYYSVDDPNDLIIFIRIEGIAIDLIIPGSASPEDAAVILSGFLSMKEPAFEGAESETEYAGSVAFSLPRANITGSAGMRFQPNWPAFIIDASLDLATPIPLGSTGLSIYGFRGLIGLRYVASREGIGLEGDAPWYQYYKKKVPPPDREGIQIEKFASNKGFSLGAGVSLATGADQGKSFSSKLFFLLSLPEVLLLQGQGAILRERIGLDTVNDPPFSAMIAISKQSVEAAFGVNYKLPEDSGKIATVDGLIEMGFFFGNNSAWYINVGRDLPADKRVQARILTLFNAYFYLMLSSGGIKVGAGASWAFSKSFGPVGIEAGAYIDLAGRISIKPKQVGGSIQLGGYAQIKVFKFKLGMSIAASLAAEAPKPFIVTGAVEVAINLPKPLKDLSVNVDFTWTFDPSLNAIQEEVIDAENLDTKPPAKALSMVTNETFSVLYHDGNSLPLPDSNWNEYVIPMDSFIDIEFSKGVYPDIAVAEVNLYGGVTTGTSAHVEFIPPQRGKSDQVKHTYEVKNIQIFSFDPTEGPDGDWVDYNPFEAYVDLNDPLFQQLTQNELLVLKHGFWQKDSSDKYNKLRVLAQSPLNFLSQGTGNLAPEELGVTSESLFCDEEELSNICIDFNPSGVLQTITEVPYDSPVNYRNVLLKMTTQDGVVLMNPSWGSDYALSIPTGNNLEIIFPESCANVNLYFANNNNATIEYYKRSLPVGTTNSVLPVYEWDLITSTSNTNYEDAANPVDRIVIINGECEESSLDCGTELTPEAQQLFNFLDALENNEDLTTTFKIYPDDSNTYENIYYGTVLYNPQYDYNNIDYTVQLLTPTQLVVTISDDKGFSCGFTLELAEYDVDFDMSEITKFENLIADPDFATNGANYHFLIQATTPDGTFTLKGTSCYPINYCFDSCSSWLYSICRLPMSSVVYNNTIPSQTQITSENNAMLDGILKITPPVWKPYTDYFIQIETKDTISNISSAPGPYSRYHSFGFRTAGPVGHFHESRQEYLDLAEVDKADQFRLASLKPYIDYTTSYPNADGNILNAKPLFYDDPKLLLYYKHAHVYTMLRNWSDYNNGDGVDIELNAVIKDPAAPNSSPTAITATLNSNKGPQSIDMLVLNNMITNSDPCSGIEGPIQPEGIHSEIETGALLPEKLYTAVYSVRTKPSLSNSSAWVSNEVHRYPFQTSRYENFEEQVQSYILSNETGNERYAVFNIDIALTSGQLSAVQAVIAGTESASDPLLLQFADPLDRILIGILELPQLDPAQTTEFNVIRNTSNGNAIVAILIRNPEPFNDPKLPASELVTTLTLSVNAGSTSGYLNVFSKDRSKIYLTKSSSSISSGSGEFTFQFKLYDGAAYTVVSTETATITLA